MKHITILALQEATLSSIDSAYQVLTRVNDFLRYQGKPSYYEVELVGLEADTSLQHGLYTIRSKRTIHELAQTDVIVLPLLCGNFPAAVKANAPYSDWVRQQYAQGAEIVSLCAGSFFLASTGLLDSRSCAVHWAAGAEFRAMYPQVNILDQAIMTDEQGIYTSAGGFSYLNLLLYLIEKHLGKDLSILAAKMFEIDRERSSQQPYMIFAGQKRHDDPVVLQAQQLIEAQPGELFTIAELCGQLHIGRRAFERRFKKMTGNSVAEYIQRVKVEYVKKQLELSGRPVNELIYETGYNDINAFRKIFKRYTDLSPVAYRKRYTLLPV